MFARYVIADNGILQVHELIFVSRTVNPNPVSLGVLPAVTLALVPEVDLEVVVSEVPQVVADRFMSQTFVPFHPRYAKFWQVLLTVWYSFLSTLAGKT